VRQTPASSAGCLFNPVVPAGGHRRSIELVAGGVVAASAIDSHMLAVEMRDHPELEKQLRVIDALGPSPIEPGVASAQLPAAVTRELRSSSGGGLRRLREG
jgi:phosphonate transport system substrate-binding protein